MEQGLGTVSGRLLAVNPVNRPGGAEIVLLRLLRGLAARDWHVTLTTPGGGALADAALADGLDWAPLATGGLGRGRGLTAVWSGWRCVRTLARDMDVVVLNGSTCGRLLPALAGRDVLTVLDVNDMVTRVPRFWRSADLILADTEAVARRLRELDPLLDPLVSGAPVDLDPPRVESVPWDGTPRAESADSAGAHPRGAAAPGPVVGFVGRLERRKGVHDLLAAIPALRAGLTTAAGDLRIVLVGDDPYASDPAYTAALLAHAAQLGVVHVGWHENAPGLMRHMDVLVLPSLSEPFGTVLAEAMAVGTPVVATAVDGLVEVVEDRVTGRLVQPGDPSGLAAAILDVLDHREAMGAAARTRAQRWGVEAYVTRIGDLLESAL